MLLPVDAAVVRAAALCYVVSSGGVGRLHICFLLLLVAAIVVAAVVNFVTWLVYVYA